LTVIARRQKKQKKIRNSTLTVCVNYIFQYAAWGLLIKISKTRAYEIRNETGSTITVYKWDKETLVMHKKQWETQQTMISF